MNEIKRRGNVNKCPVCGSSVDADAFHCPSCRSYFCYQCRARILESDEQLQCVNQSCEYYGKLNCGICDTKHEQVEPPAVYGEPEDGYWPAWLVLMLLVCALMLCWFSFVWVAAIGIAVYATGGFLMQRYGINIFGREKRVEYQRRSTYHTCICCGERVKEVHTVA